jgi:uncharacterized protein YndB with AHSA1/START domain
LPIWWREKPIDADDVVVVERKVKARPEEVFKYFADPVRWMFWQGVEAEIELKPGGIFRVNVTGDGFASGRFLEVVENRRVVFTWGWEVPGSAVPPGSSTVVIELDGDDKETVIRLTHSGLPAEELNDHQQGWNHYVDRLAIASAGGDPGPDRIGGSVNAPRNQRQDSSGTK